MSAIELEIVRIISDAMMQRALANEGERESAPNISDMAREIAKLFEAELARVESVLVAADRVREAYDAMLEGRKLGPLPDFEDK